MASDGVIFASKMDVYSHILNKNNSILISNKSIHIWKAKIEAFLKKIKNIKLFQKMHFKVVKNYTWQNRVRKIERFLNASKTRKRIKFFKKWIYN